MFHKIPIADAGIPKTAVITPSGLFVFTVIMFVRLNLCACYIDDILIVSESPERHQEHLRLAFQRLSDYGVDINFSKCIFSVEFGKLEFPDRQIN